MLLDQYKKIDRTQYPKIKIGTITLSIMRLKTKDGVVTTTLAGLGGDRVVQRQTMPALHSFHRFEVKSDRQSLRSIRWITCPLVSAQQDAEAWLRREEARVANFLYAAALSS